MKIVEVLIYELENQNVLQSSDVETRIIEQGNPKTIKNSSQKSLDYKRVNLISNHRSDSTLKETLLYYCSKTEKKIEVY
jgi:hypothetical protein